MAFQTVRGFKDTLPPASEHVLWLERVARGVFSTFGYSEIRIPTLESQDLFVKSTGETTDIVEKEMFLLEDSGGRKLALRPEGTPGVVRAYCQHHLDQQGGRTKLYYVGNMFRAERPQAGRFREFEQIGVESFGDKHPAADAEIILMLARILEKAGLAGRFAVHVNDIGCENPDCRPAYRTKLLKFLKTVETELCDNCKRRMARNPLRVLDCKEDGPKLKGRMPKLETCAECRTHSEGLFAILKAQSLDFSIDPSLVRGLDYYTRTVFEFRSKDVGSQDALAGGGRYDGLVKSMGGPDVPGTGWAMGVERTLLAVEEAFKSHAGEAPPNGSGLVYVAVPGEQREIEQAALKLVYDIRRMDVACEGAFFGHSLKSQMREADKLGARYVVILGSDEISAGKCSIKDMRAKDRQETVDLSRAPERLAELLGRKGK